MLRYFVKGVNDIITTLSKSKQTKVMYMYYI